MGKVIPLRIEDAMADQLDRLIAMGIFLNRNDGIRAGVREILKPFVQDRSATRLVVAMMVANHLADVHAGEIEAICLFGSVATGKDTSESDIDLFVLTSRPLPYTDELAIISDAGRLLRGVDEYVSLHFENKADFTRALEEGYNFEASILKLGRLLAGHMPRNQ